jgi:phosphopantetheinyl transferase
MNSSIHISSPNSLHEFGEEFPIIPIFWSLKRITDQINEIDLTDPSPFLGEQENAVYQKFKFPKRKRDWLGARIVAKDLIRASDDRWKQTKVQSIELLNEGSGAPYLDIQGSRGYSGRVSLSHSNGYVLCAYSPEDIRFGVDLELIEPRSNAFSEDFFTTIELEQIAKMGIAEQRLYITVIWSGKESALKALSTGLRVDTRSVEITIPEQSIEQNGWRSLDLKSSMFINDSLSLLWRREGDFVLTACVPSGYKEVLLQIDL